MLERDRLSLKKWREEYAAEQAAEKEQRERPIRELEMKLQENHRALAKVMREQLTTIPDPNIYQDEEVVNSRQSDTEVMVQNTRETEIFLATNPWFHPCDGNSQIIMSYIERNGRTRSITAALLHDVASRMRELGLLEEPPLEPAPMPQPEVVEQSVVKTEPKPEVFRGWDTATGKPRNFSKFEVDRMTGDHYARSFRLDRAKMLLAG
jgi:hypothetical protein